MGWVEVESETLQTEGPKTGMVIDYAEIAGVVESMQERYLDHYCLNESLGLESPTSEEVARWVYRCLREHHLPVSAVTIEETCTSVCTFRP